jgi:hypothetical protein
VSKANLQDVTDPAGPIPIAGNLTLEMTITDRGEPGSADSIGIALWRRDELLFSSRWNGTRTTEQTLAGGNLVVHSGQPLLLAGPPSQIAVPAAPLTLDALAPIAAEAVRRWSALGPGDVEYRIADLPGSLLGLAERTVITIDTDAAGQGWFIDQTPADDLEFGNAPQGSAVAGRVDLLTVVAHELGHVLGLEDLAGEEHADAVMAEVLEPGLRRVPGAEQTAAVLAAVPGKAALPVSDVSSGTQGATKFFVVDPAAGATFRYGPDGSPVGSFALDSTVVNPRGVASNATGDTLWVIDGTTREVTVHGSAGAGRGSWRAEGLARPEDIATDGRNIWIVDAGLGQVLRYAGGAYGRGRAGGHFVCPRRGQHLADGDRDGRRAAVGDRRCRGLGLRLRPRRHPGGAVASGPRQCGCLGADERSNRGQPRPVGGGPGGPGSVPLRRGHDLARGQSHGQRDVCPGDDEPASGGDCGSALVCGRLQPARWAGRKRLVNLVGPDPQFL